ncbi:hypothetical protein HJG60_011063 [Phyllostomus discolor]|uniref:Uncharacterized protein n=1 Tax=Phyllostomus discolor TaxID=89673 RepID=A0A834A7K7_9CHIR|nr:hypothetical protein HJG60_011063 [Phyllostomus discolor]
MPAWRSGRWAQGRMETLGWNPGACTAAVQLCDCRTCAELGWSELKGDVMFQVPKSTSCSATWEGNLVLMLNFSLCPSFSWFPPDSRFLPLRQEDSGPLEGARCIVTPVSKCPPGAESRSQETPSLAIGQGPSPFWGQSKGIQTLPSAHHFPLRGVQPAAQDGYE